MGATAILDSEAVKVAPGDQASCEVRIRNTGHVVDQFILDVVGIEGDWIRVEPETVNLLPGDEATARVQISPPRSSSVLAGEKPFALRVMSSEDTAGSVVQEGTVTVLPFADIAAELVPRTSRGRRKGRHELAVDNNGNHPTTVDVLVADPDNALKFRCEPGSVVTEPGTATFVKITATPIDRYLRGPDQRLPFQVLVSPEAAPSVTLDGAMLHRPLIPKGLLKALALAAAAIVALVVLWQTVLKPTIQSTATDAASAEVSKQVAGVKASASAAQSQASQAQSQASQAQSQAGQAQSQAGQAQSKASQAVAGGAGGAIVGTPTDFRLAAKATPNASGTFTTYTYQPAKKHSLTVSDVILQNPMGDKGLLQIRRNNAVLIEVALTNFRDLDYHFVVPLAFTDKDQVVLAVNCTNSGTTACTPAAYLSGQLSK